METSIKVKINTFGLGIQKIMKKNPKPSNIHQYVTR